MIRRKRQWSTGNTNVDRYVVRIDRRTAPRDGGSGTLKPLLPPLALVPWQLRHRGLRSTSLNPERTLR